MALALCVSMMAKRIYRWTLLSFMHGSGNVCFKPHSGSMYKIGSGTVFPATQRKRFTGRHFVHSCMALALCVSSHTAAYSMTWLSNRVFQAKQRQHVQYRFWRFVACVMRWIDAMCPLQTMASCKAETETTCGRSLSKTLTR